MKAKKKTIHALWHTDNLALNGKKQKLFTYIKCWREKKGKQKTPLCHHSHLFTSEYQALWLTLNQGHCASKLPSPHSCQHKIWKHSIGMLLMVSSHKVKLIAAILRCNWWLQACFICKAPYLTGVAVKSLPHLSTSQREIGIDVSCQTETESLPKAT